MSSSLDFTIKLTDRVTAPLKRVQSQFKSFNATAASSFKKVGGGSIALFAVAKSITGLLSPAEEMDRALKNASLGGVSSINELRTAAKKFSAEYGTSAIDFVNSASSIKGALSGISDADVPQAVAAMNMLSKATGDSVETSTGYIEQMAANYKGAVNKIGHLNFARHAAGIVAYAKNNFNVSTQQLQNMMLKTKGTAANNGVSMAEQSVVLGMASKSLGAGAAGSYAALYKNLGKAGKELGLSFADANGKMLSMPEIIAKIQGKFGKDLSKNIKAQEALDKAFGAGADIVKTLANNSDEFNQHMTEIGKGQNFKLMQKMAQGNVKPLERINAQFMNIKESIGRALLPVLMPVMNAISGIIGKFAKWLEMFPNIAKWIGIITIALISLAGIAAVFAIISGVISLLLSPITLIIIGIAAVIALCWVFRKQISNAIDWVIEKVKSLWSAFSETWVFKMIAGSLKFIGKVFLLLWKIVKFGIKVWVSLFVWLKDTVVSAFSDAITLVSQFWDYMKDTLYIQLWIESFNLLSDFVCGVFEFIGDTFISTIDDLTAGWDSFVEFFTDADAFSKVGDALKEAFWGVFKIIQNKGIDVINTIIDGLNYIPGVNIELLEYEKIDAPEQSPVSTAKSPITSTLVRDIDHGGLSKEIQNSKSQNIDNSKNIQSVSIYNSQPMTPAQLQEWEQLYAG
ncbi:phage tail tape measure protein [Gilliamella sp. Nev3-1]|uniref:phage tail tape measure protein n=1 Tax=Gilliamella sp. Nev3-1 TaxID=3120250 RepID=UPI00080DBEFD|nr:phage tail tape measure protein [Gilliamella apicola]OCG60809.1 phage tail tape measure protein [Gilliamella apicola]